MLLLAGGCIGTPPIIVDKAPCSSLIPDSYRKPVGHAPDPREVRPADATPAGQIAYLTELGKAWMEYGIAESAQVEKADGRTADVIDLQERCEKRDAAAVKASRPKFLGIF